MAVAGAAWDNQSQYLLEQFIPGRYFTWRIVRKSGFYAPKTHAMDAAGSTFPPRRGCTTRTLQRDSPKATVAQRNPQNIGGLARPGPWRHSHGISENPMPRPLYFSKLPARMARLHFEVVQAATGINLWREWAQLEVAGKRPYHLPPPHEDLRRHFSLARQQEPGYLRVQRTTKSSIASRNITTGLRLKSYANRIEELLALTKRRFVSDSWPAQHSDKPTS